MSEQPNQAEGKRSLLLRILRVAGKVLLWLLGVLIGLLSLAWLALVVFFPDDKIRTLALAEVEDRTGWQLQAGELDLEILSGLVLSDVRLLPPPGFEQAPLTVERIVVDYSLADLLDDRLVVRQVRVERPVVRVISHEGRTNLQALFEQLKTHKRAATRKGPASEPGNFILELQSVQVVDARFELRGPAGLRLEMNDLDFSIAGQWAGPEQTQLSAAIDLPLPDVPNLWLGKNGPAAAVGTHMEAKLSGFSRVALKADLTLKALRLLSEAEPQTLGLTLKAGLDLAEGVVVLESLSVAQAERSLARVQGSFAIEERLLSIHMPEADLSAPIWFALLGLDPKAFGLTGQLRLSGAVLKWPLGHEALPSVGGILVADGLGMRLGGFWLSELNAELNLKAEPGKERSIQLAVRGPVSAATLVAGPVQLSGARLSLGISGLLSGLEATPSFSLTAFEAPSELARVELPGLQLDVLHLEPRVDGSCDLLEKGLACNNLDLGIKGSLGALRAARARMGASTLSLDLALTDLNLPASGIGSAKLGGLRGGLSARAARIKAKGLDAKGPWVKIDLRGLGLTPHGRFQAPLKVRARFGVGPLTTILPGPKAAPGPTAQSVAVDLSTRIPSTRVGHLPIALEARVVDASMSRAGDAPPWQIKGLSSVVLSGGLLPNKLHLDISSFDARLAELLKLHAKGTFDAAIPAMDVTFSTSEHRLERLVAALPSDIRTRVPPLNGGVQVSGRFAGPLRVARDWRKLPFMIDLVVNNRGVSTSFAPAGIQIEGLSGPVRLVAGAGQVVPVRSRVKLSMTRAKLGAAGLDARGVVISLASHLTGEALQSDGRLRVKKLVAGFWPEPLSGIQWDFASLQTGFKELRLTDMSLVLDSAGLGLTGEGQVVMTPGASHWSDLRLSLDTQARFAATKPVSLPGGLRASGAAEMTLGLRSVSPGVFSTAGRFSFDGLSVERVGVSLTGMRGGIPISQFVRVRPAFALLARREGQAAVDPDGSAVRSSAYDQALRPLKGQSRSFAIEKAVFKDLTFSDLSGNLELAGGVLTLGSLRFGFLGGDVVCDTEVIFAPADKRRLSLDAEMSGIDLSGLGALLLAGSSDISGNLRLGVDLNERDVTSSFNLTRIGRSTLQALLLAADPEESNPGLMQFRKFLTNYKVAPREVGLDVRHGLLSMRVRMEMGTLARAAASFVQGFRDDTFAITHIPVSGFMSKYMDF